MFIKSIVLDGFKSYGQRTEITGFDEQFNAITGLNGSGKSNILDSICFVLGISNLNQVRATNLQDLIYKSGQCGINKATVSITFDNRNPEQCPPGFQNVSEITITRQIVMGGKNKYMINGSTVPNKKIQDLFCSVQLNVNNPHFLIMQGKITKVLNMKPFEILAMIEEAAGTKMYEAKKQISQKTIEKKDAKLNELRSVLNEDLLPRLEKLRTERVKYLEFKNIERELDHMLHIYQAWEFLNSQRRAINAKQALDDEENKLKVTENNKFTNQNEIKTLTEEIETLSNKAKAEGNNNLDQVESELKSVEASQAKINAKLKSIKDNIETECKQKIILEKNLIDDEKALKMKENELNKLQEMFEKLRENDELDNEAFKIAQKRYEALSAGMELNEDGQAETLQEQLMNVRQEASKINTEMKQATMRLDFCQKQLKEKQKRFSSNINEVNKDEKCLEVTNKDITILENQMKKLHFNEDKMNEIQQKRRGLQQEIHELTNKIDQFEAQKPYTQFHYRDPETNFNRKNVFGVVCRLISVRNDVANLALETAAGGKLYNVAIDSDITGKKLLQNGDLQHRTTFIPINKIQAHKMNDNIVKYAEDLVGKDNVQSALAHIEYDKKLTVVMEYIFGNVFICKDINVARQIAFNNRIRRRCVTLDGDVVDPAGTLTGGAPPRGGSILKQIQEIKKIEEELKMKMFEFDQIETEIREMNTKYNEYMNLKQQLEIKQHEINIINQRLQQSSHFKRQEEMNQLKMEINELEMTIKNCTENEKKFIKKMKELEMKISQSKGGRDEQIKAAEKEMKMLQSKADKSRKEWKRKEQDYETFNLEISELKKSLEHTQQQIDTTKETIGQLQENHDTVMIELKNINENVKQLQIEVKKEKSAINDKNKEIQRKLEIKEKLQSKITDFDIKIKEHHHKLKKLKEEHQNLITKQKDCEKRVKEKNLKEAEQLTDAAGQRLEMDIRKAQEKKGKLARTVNDKAQTLFEQQEKEYNEIKKKEEIVEKDKKKIIQTMKDLDKKKEEVLKIAYAQISKDFGSIFSTLLPGANAKLLPPIGQTILQGLEVKVSLGGIWKENLTELSGGQRSLAALSLILAMLLFKPAPLYILDEVDAALDLSHTQNIGSMLKTHFKKSQFIIVSLKDGMFSNANVLFKTQFVDGVSTITRTTNKKNI